MTNDELGAGLIRLEDGQREILAAVSELKGAKLPERVAALETGPNRAIRLPDCEGKHLAAAAWGRALLPPVLAAFVSSGLTAAVMLMLRN